MRATALICGGNPLMADDIFIWKLTLGQHMSCSPDQDFVSEMPVMTADYVL
jgi:hypothetical protein